MTTPDIRLITTDLDGTLVQDASDISEANIGALKAALDRGIEVCIATGRTHQSASQFARRLGIEESLIISFNGAMVRRANEDDPLRHVPVPSQEARGIVDMAREGNHSLLYFVEDDLYVTHMHRWAWRYLERTGDCAEPVGDLRRLEGTSPTKLLIADEPDVIAELLERDRERFEDRLYVTRSLAHYIEYLNPKATKGHALAWLADHLGVGLEHAMALGDQLNDLPMIEEAAVGGAMPGACEQVREAAAYVAESASEGVAEALEQVLNIRP